MSDSNQKPRYIDPTGDPRSGSLPVRPPFLMAGVSSRVFPLKANMARLTQFCDEYLNMDIPPGIVQFRPAVPYVYLMVLDYGSMSSASVQAQNVGWVAQHEVAFTVPLERWREEKGRLVFKGWACVSPFIFVDDDMSLTTGREVYGWAKVAGRVDAETPLWASDPRSATRLFTFSTHVFPKVYAGEQESPQVLLQIDSDPAPNYARVPPDLSGPWYPLSAAATAMRSSMSLMGTAVDMALGLRIRGYRTDRNLTSFVAMSGKAGDLLKQFLPGLALAASGKRRTAAVNAAAKAGPSFDNVTVKQFRDAQEPDRACYKALVNSAMGIDRLNESGLLGDMHLLRGDTSGGYTLRIHRYTSQPIIESLGLDVAATEERDDGGSVAVLKPTFPFWTDVDLLYGAGRVICSRTHGQGDDDDDAWIDEQRGETIARTESPRNKSAHAETDHSDYNTSLGAATQPVAGPFEFPDVTLQVYPLLAERSKLDACLEQYLNGPLATTGLRFETFGSYVYMLVKACGDQLGTMWSSANNIGWWAEREVSFCVPVKWFRNGELISVGIVAPFVYANNGRAVITDREVNGRPSIEATIESPQDVWLTASGPASGRRFLRLATEAFPALHLGQKGQSCTLVEIDERDVLPYNDDVGWRMVAQSWGERLVDDLKRKTEERQAAPDVVQSVKALALELLAHETPINWINIKQYRDAADMERACYQAAVHTTCEITRIYDIREIEQNVHVRVHRLSGHPIVESLGLKVMSEDSNNGQVVDNLQPVRPFWMRVSLKERLGTVIARRSIDEKWQVTHPWFAATNPTRSEPAGKPAATPANGSSPYFQKPDETRVGVSLGGPQVLWQGLRDQATGWLRTALADELRSIRRAPEANSIGTPAPWFGGLDPIDRADFERLDSASSVEAFCDGTSIERQMALIRIEREQRGASVRSAAGPAATDKRMTYDEARAAVIALGEVQLVVESILSDEWENWGNPRRYQKLPPKPEQCIPSNSIYGGSWILNRNTADFVADHGLSITADGLCWFVEPKRVPAQQ